MDSDDEETKKKKEEEKKIAEERRKDDGRKQKVIEEMLTKPGNFLNVKWCEALSFRVPVVKMIGPPASGNLRLKNDFSL